jgi:hypothetical protein
MMMTIKMIIITMMRVCKGEEGGWVLTAAVGVAGGAEDGGPLRGRGVNPTENTIGAT